MLYFKNSIKIITLVSGIILAAQATANVQPNTDKALKLSTILEKLSNEGYTNIQDVEIEDGILSVEGMNDKGVPFEVQLNPETGKILKQKTIKQPKYSIIEIVKKIESEGKLNIVEIEFDEAVYKVKALTADKKEKEMHFDPQTGEKLTKNP